MTVKRDVPDNLPAYVQEVVDDFRPIVEKLKPSLGTYAWTIGGSMGKATWQEGADIDFRLFHEHPLSSEILTPEILAEIDAKVAAWGKRGVNVDGFPFMGISDFNAKLEPWLAGECRPDPIIWTIWGFYIVPNMQYQIAIDDPAGLVEAWKARLATYPPVLKERILAKNLESLRYWAADYHYRGKAERHDIVFLAGLSSRLVHEVIQVLFALNETFYVGDGNNLRYVSAFPIRPERVAERITAILYPGDGAPGEDRYVTQREEIVSLIADVEGLVAMHS